MKILVNILLGIINFIVVILSLAFIIIEARLLFSLDFIIYDNAINGFIRYFLRLVISLYVFITAIFVYINMIKEKEKISKLLLISILSIFIVSIILLFTTTNYVGFICSILSLIYFVLYIVKLKILHI